MMLDRPPGDALDAGPHKIGPGTERFCVATRTVQPVDRLIRFVIGPEGVVPDVKRKLPGRGLWITADKATLKDAIARNVFVRSFKREVRVSAELVDLTERLLVRTALDALAIAGKSGLVATGFSKVEAALARGPVSGLLHAADAGADGVAKLNRALRQRHDGERLAVVTDFTSAQLNLALGRPNVVHAALLAGPASSTFLARCARLASFRTSETSACGRGRTRN